MRPFYRNICPNNRRQTAAFLWLLSFVFVAWSPAGVRAADENAHSVPLFDDGVMIRVPVSAFGKTLYFLLDSGFTCSALDTRYEPFLGESIDTYRGDSPLGTASSLPVFPGPRLSLAAKPLRLDKVVCLDLQLPRLITGHSCDGVLGMDFLSQSIVSLDFDKEIMYLDGTVPHDLKENFTAVPLKRSSIYYSVDVMVDHSRPLTLMVDTGDNSSISLNATDWQSVFGSNTATGITATVGDVANQIKPSKIGVIENLTIGGLRYTNLHATFIGNPRSPSHLGLGFFKRHEVTFDFPNKMLYLKPGERFALADKEDMSGLHLLREGDMTVVYSVDTESPADHCGVKPEDVILSLNGQNASTLTMRSIRRVLKSAAGEKIALEIKRRDKVLKMAFTLKNAI
jgi:hypothetical protein